MRHGVWGQGDEIEADLSKLRKELAAEWTEMEVLKTAHMAPMLLLNRNSRQGRSHPVAVSARECWPVKKLAKEKLSAHLSWRHRVTPFRKLIKSECPSCAWLCRRWEMARSKRSQSRTGFRSFIPLPPASIYARGFTSQPSVLILAKNQYRRSRLLWAIWSEWLIGLSRSVRKR